MKIKLNALRTAIKAVDEDSAGVTLVERRATLVAEGQKVLTEIKALDEPDAEAVEAVKSAADQLKVLDAKIEKADASAGVMRKMAGLEPSRGGGTWGGGTGGVKFLGLSTAQGRKAAVAPLAKAMAGPDPLGKAVVPDGTAVGTIPLVGVFERPELPTSILDLLPMRTVAPYWSYLREVERTDNAAVVPVGEVKPTSVYRDERVEDRLRVVAHLSEPIDKYILEDFGVLSEYLQNRMIRGLNLGVEKAILTGDGAVSAGPPKVDNIKGILNVSGVQLQAWATDLLTTIRKGITALEVLGHEATALVLSPADWEKLELTRRAGDGAFDLGPANLPVDRAKRLVWGVPTVVSNILPAKTGILMDTSAVEFVGDGQIGVEWNRFSGFTTNEIMMRVEGRFGVALTTPLGVVKLATAA
ncbi:phage major capsid protein [Rhodococcus sp. NPDC060176]|uniref:phage major capsid protein n=1 Tax=Rhodococcus sp. NPDC060176 TaxID=3347062 RepID=UPI003662BECB